MNEHRKPAETGKESITTHDLLTTPRIESYYTPNTGESRKHYHISQYAPELLVYPLLLNYRSTPPSSSNVHGSSRDTLKMLSPSGLTTA